MFGYKTTFIRLPGDEVQRMIGGIIYHAIQAMDGTPGHVQDIGAIGAGNLPNLNPAIDISMKWKDFVLGNNPKDDFRDRGILTNDVWLAGGWEATRDMFAWTAQTAGVHNFVKWNRDAQSWQELTVSAIPGVNRFVKVSDSGMREAQEEGMQGDDILRAKIRRAMPESAQRLYGEYNALARLGTANRTMQQELRYRTLSGWYRGVYMPAMEVAVASEGKSTISAASMDMMSAPFKNAEK
jgi:hypothetical protein